MGESTPVSSSEQPIVPIPVSSSFSAAIGESSMTASSSSSSYVRVYKKEHLLCNWLMSLLRYP
ncbi:hypothetical protein [Candidatus Ichthyocystis sparus]|uniref:hypothetical protein n=1 Tax=Candidatus Ichthyocystis sparus TaxID=1561004 RepID=UPI000B803DCA|nr:hypothetical protein [Candidatus Ichthyocystis sparus]